MKHLLTLALWAAMASVFGQNCPKFEQLMTEAKNQKEYDDRFLKYESAEVVACNEEQRARVRARQKELFGEMNKLRADAEAALAAAEGQRQQLQANYFEFEKLKKEREVTDSLLLVATEEKLRVETEKSELVSKLFEKEKSEKALLQQKMVADSLSHAMEIRAAEAAQARADSINRLNEAIRLMLRQDAEAMFAIKKVPESLKGVDLPYIKLDAAGLEKFPEQILQVKTLETLLLQNNELKSIPKAISELKRLQILNLSNNRIDDLPSSFYVMHKMQALYLAYNRFAVFPMGITYMKQLQRLDLSGNRIERIPPDIFNLEELNSLDLSANRIKALPVEMLLLPRLQNLNLSNNKIEALPLGFAQWRELHTLNLSSNHFKVLSVEIAELRNLKGLDLSKNDLKKLPDGMADLKNLNYLNLKGNRFSAAEVAKIRQAMPWVVVEN